MGQRRAFLKDDKRLEGEIIDISGRRPSGDGTDTGWVKFKMDDDSIELVKPSAIPFD